MTSTAVGGPRSKTGRRSISARQIAAAVLVAFVVVVIAQNRDSVAVSVLFLDLSAPLWLTLTVTALIGAVVGQLLVRRRAAVRRRSAVSPRR